MWHHSFSVVCWIMVGTLALAALASDAAAEDVAKGRELAQALCSCT
jgi:hypothetical protein